VALGTRVRERIRPLVFFGHNGVSLLGAALTTSAAVTLIVFWAVDLFREQPAHPYEGILLFLILPALFALGLVLIPIGILLRRRRLLRTGGVPSVYPHVDLKLDKVRRGLAIVAMLTVANLAILGTASYKGVEYMDSNQFCGLTCHKVMGPEYSAFLASPHVRVGCARCHIGPGPRGFVRAKLSGVRQLYEVSLGTYSQPIPSPVKDLRPARETCEQCHWPDRFVGDKFRVSKTYAADEANTASTTVLVLKIGGQHVGGGVGIHGRHIGERVNITYTAADRQRQVIPRVAILHPDGRSDEYVSADPAPSPDPEGGEQRLMDCMDCHNRPAHTFEMPERAVDEALAMGRMDPRLPYIKKKAVEALRTEYTDQDTAARRIAEDLEAFYRASYPAVLEKQRPGLNSSIGAVQAIYRRNVFPQMNVKWGTYPNNIGHTDFNGCFRCHDDNHKRSDGTTITQDCTACHTILAQDERDPKVLSALGLQ
jgi:nitrate/TMAO reductase-like tetraheme cytochrome c subunit